MDKKPIENILKDFGLTEKETEVYIFLAKHGLLKGRKIVRQMKKDKGQIYRILKSLQKKGLVEATLEYPTRFTAVPFEKVIDSFIKFKREEVAQIEKGKKNLISVWNKISQTEIESSLEKFAVIEGNKKIHHKISQMVKETSSQLSMALTVSDLFRTEQFGVFDILPKHPMKSKIQFQAITQLSKQNLKAAKVLKPKLKPNLVLKGINPDLGSPPFSRMVIRDNEEAILFISDRNEKYLEDRETCLLTNNKKIIQAFIVVFEDLWHDSIDIEDLIVEIETGKPSPKTQLIKNPERAKNIYYEFLDSAKDEILIVTSSSGLIELSKNRLKLEDWSKRGISIKIMAPIVNKNLAFAQQLLKWGEVRHIPLGYFETTIIDGHHLFQFRYETEKQKKPIDSEFFENTFYTNDFNYVQKTKNILYDLWRKTRIPSSESLRSITSFQLIPENPSVGHHSIERKMSFMKNIEYTKRKITEKDVIEKIKNEKKLSSGNSGSWSKIKRYFGYKGVAAIYPPANSALPDMIIGVMHHDKDSTFGNENLIYVNMIQKNGKTFNYIPVAIIQDNAKSIPFRIKVFEGYPVADNIMLVEKNEIQVKVKGKTLFAGWTKPISLGFSNYTLPAACLLFEGYDDIKSGIYTNTLLSGRRQESWYNSFDAFCSFFLPQLKHVGSGTEAFFERETIFISKPPKLAHQP
ncbi:TrmB family transcriptional regulator [Thermoproteota archaeon]